MAKRAAKSKSRDTPLKWVLRPVRRAARYALRGALGLFLLAVLLIMLFRFVPPPTTFTILSEGLRLGGVERHWVSIDRVPPEIRRAVVAAEDANFCNHWGFDVKAIRAALKEGAARGASTISQQTVKNVFLWQGRSWPRKALEALLTPVVEALWPKRRILEVYLNVAEFGEGVFGIDAAARHYFGVAPDKLSAAQGARLAVVLPSPKERNPANLPTWLRKRAARVQGGAATIEADGRASCFDS